MKTHLLVGREDGKASASGLVLVWCPQSPEGDGTTTELGEPALQLRLGSIVGQATKVQDLAPFRQKGPNISMSIHGTSEDLRVFLGRLRLADQATKHTGESDRFLHGPAGRSGGQSLQVERKVVLNRGGRLNGLDLKGSADVGEGAGTERQRLGMMGLPALIFSSQVESAGMLQVCGQHDGLVAGLAGQLHPQIPRVQRHKSKLEVFASEVFLGEGVESRDGIPEGPCGANVFPCQSGQARFGELLAKNRISRKTQWNLRLF